MSRGNNSGGQQAQRGNWRRRALYSAIRSSALRKATPQPLKHAVHGMLNRFFGVETLVALAPEELGDLILQGQRLAEEGAVEEGLQILLLAAEIDRDHIVIVDTIRRILSAPGVMIDESLGERILSFYKDNDFIVGCLQKVTGRLTNMGIPLGGLEEFEKDLRAMSLDGLAATFADRFRRGDVYLGLFFREVARRLADSDGGEKTDRVLTELSQTAFGADLLLAGARVIQKVAEDRALAEDLGTVLSYVEQSSLLQEIVQMHGGAPGNDEGEERAISTVLLARATVMQGRDTPRYGTGKKAARAVLYERVRRRPNDWKAQLDFGRSCVRRPRGVRDGFYMIGDHIRDDFLPEMGIEALQRAQTLNPNDACVAEFLLEGRRSALEPFLFVGFPRSGSVFVYTSLVRGLDINSVGAVHGGAFPNFTLAQEGFNLMLIARGTSHTHLAASQVNLLEISARYGLEKMIVHVRDPRQCLLSWHDFLPRILTEMDPIQGKHYDIPDDYLSYSSDRQMDWLIDNWLPKLVKWLRDWKEADRAEWFQTRIYFSRFEDLRADQSRFFWEIRNFLGAAELPFEEPSPPKGQGDRNFRKGDIDSWRATLTPAQRAGLGNSDRAISGFSA